MLHPPNSSLDYLRSSPVRGQLEPFDPKTPQGWRYIQTTDTLDELKVLLPPGTAAMYEQLLKFEVYELSKKTTVAWERVIQIRHLKDRMIRKCQRLAKALPPNSKRVARDRTIAFQTFVAPDDFRVKAMEKWFREQQKNVALPSKRRPSSLTRIANPSRSYCVHCGAPEHTGPHMCIDKGPAYPSIASSSKGRMQRSITNPEPKSPFRNSSKTFSTALVAHSFDPNKSTSRQEYRSVTPEPPPSITSIASPPPLPILLRGQREEFGLEISNDHQDVEGSSKEVDTTKGPSPSNSTDQELLPSRPPLHRRRSCIKRESIGDIAKTVSWADDQERDQQVTKYATAAREAQASGKWNQVRDLYLDQIIGLENLQLQVQEGLDHLSSETQHLQRVDDTIRRQRENLHFTFNEFEKKQLVLQSKVQEAIQEAEALVRHGVKKDLTAIEEASDSHHTVT